MKQQKKKNRDMTNVDPTASQGIHTIMSHSTDTPGPAVVLHTLKGERFLFGHVTEGTQRAILEQKFRVSRLSGMYLTGPISWSTVSGLAGFLLTLVGQGRTDMDLRSCGHNVDWICATWRHFVFHKTMGIRTDRMTKGHVTEEVNIGGVLLTPRDIVEQQLDSEEVDSIDQPRGLQPLKKDTPWENISRVLKVMFGASGGEYGYDKKELKRQSETPLPAAEKDHRSTCYIIQMHPKKGKFNVNAANALGIPKAMFKELHQGKDVTLEDGTVVNPSQCVDSPQNYGRILILDIPNEAYVDSVVNCPEWLRKYDSSIAQPVYGSSQKRNSQDMETMEEDNCPEDVAEPYVSTVYHFFGAEMESYFAGNECQAYFDWMQSLGANVLHIISAPWLDPQELTFRGSAHLSWKLRKSLGDMFPVPLRDYRTLTEPDSDFVNKEDIKSKLNMTLLTSGDATAIEAGQEGVTRVFHNKLRQYDGVDEMKNETTIVNREFSGDSIKSRTELLTLGTGSACPSKYRNVAGLIMRVPRADGTFTGVVMDCGEGTFGTLSRMYSPEGRDQILQEIKMIYISHLHADHHLGTPLFIEQWIKANPGTSKLQVVAPQGYKRFLEECANFRPEMRSRIEFYGCWSFLQKFNSEQQLPNVSGLTSLKTCYAHHCDQSYCVEFGFDLDGTPLRFAYSGDTRPIDSFAELAKNCDLVVHEATLDNDLAKEAIIKRHCTFEEALSVCGKMDAKNVVLTHFSQRYPKLPELSALTLTKPDGERVPVAVAFDMMRIRLGEVGQQADHFAAITEALGETQAEEQAEEGNEK